MAVEMARSDGWRRLLSDVGVRTLAGVLTAAVLALCGIAWAVLSRPSWRAVILAPVAAYWMVISALAAVALLSAPFAIGLRRTRRIVRVAEERALAAGESARELRARVERLEGYEALEAHHGAYWARSADGSLDGPFLASAWDRDRKRVLMQRHVRHYVGEPQDEYVFLDQATQQRATIPVSFMVDHKVRAYLEAPEFGSRERAARIAPSPYIRRNSY